MRIRRTALSALASVVLTFSLYAQEAAPPALATDLNANPYVRGEQTISFNLGTLIPISFIDLYAGGGAATNCYVGAGFGLAYNYVLSTGFSLGGEVSGATCATLGESSFFMVPFTVKASWYFVKMPFEIVPSVAGGLSIVRYNIYTQFDPILKAGAAFLWRQSSSWSFGIDTQAWTVWQFFSDPADNRLGIFLSAQLTAVYHL